MAGFCVAGGRTGRGRSRVAPEPKGPTGAMWPKGDGRLDGFRAAVVGAGRRAAHLMRAMPAAGFEVAGVVEPDAARLAAALEACPGARGFGDVAELVSAREGVDCAFILTPPDRHAEPFVACVRAGLPAFCEKPADMELGAVERMRAAAVQAGVPTLVGFNRRFTPVARLARALTAGRPPLFVQASKSRPMAYSRMLAENAVHAADLLLWLAAAPVQAVGAAARFKDELREIEAFAAAAVTFVGGGGGLLQMVTGGSGGVERLEVYGEGFTLTAELPDRGRYVGDLRALQDAARSAGLQLREEGGGCLRVQAGGSDPEGELAAFATRLRGSPVEAADIEAAYAAQALVEAVYAAAGLPPTRGSTQWIRES